MSNFLGSMQSIAVWSLFFLTTVYGHVALKLAVREEPENLRQMWDSALSIWGWTAWISWGASALLWMIVVSKQSLLTASSISALRYILICLAAWAVLRDPIGWRESIGIVWITAGIILIAR